MVKAFVPLPCEPMKRASLPVNEALPPCLSPKALCSSVNVDLLIAKPPHSGSPCYQFTYVFGPVFGEEAISVNAPQALPLYVVQSLPAGTLIFRDVHHITGVGK